jgi:tripartite-type tricarboxylate transporter receptor subunit TctC
LLKSALTSAAFALVATSAFAADNYPARPIRIVDPFSPGGSTEAQARALAQKLNEAWGQPVVIDARPGAGSSLGSSVVAQATPDGYTLLMNNVGLVTSALLAKRPPYEPTKDFAGVIMTGTQPQFIVVNPSLPSTLKEFIAYAKANPGKVNFGSSGVGGSSHLSMEYFKIATGTDLTHVPYKGSNPSATAIIAGEIQMGSCSGTSVLPLIRSGKMRALAVTTLKRAAVMPEVPTADEQGLKGYEVVTWGGIFAPSKTPSAIVAKLNQQMNAALQTADVKERYARIGVDVSGGAPQVLNTLLASEQKRWGKVVADAKIPKE